MVIVGSLLGVCMLLLEQNLGCYLHVVKKAVDRKNQISQRKQTRRSAGRSQIMGTSDLRVFSFADLKAATENFRPGMFGKAGFGRMFKGWVDENTLAPSTVIGTGMAVAVKRFYSGSSEDIEQWQLEVVMQRNLSHPNLVNLLGCCREKDDMFLVYEFMQNGSLPNHLFRKFLGSRDKESLSWDNGLRIAIGAARGLTFLHNLQIIHRDVKPTNILLDGSNNAKLSNFHYAISGPANGEPYMSAWVCGTVGYIDPDYMITGHLSVKSDVYSFGVVLLQILTGLMACDYSRPEEQICLVDWAIPLLSHEAKLQTIKDAQREGLYSSSSQEASRTANLILKCLERDPQSRPSMQEVLEELERILAKEN